MTNAGIEKLATGITSFDIIAKGGLPRNRTTLVSGTAGSGKTVFAVQFLAAGNRHGTPGVFVTFEESADDIREEHAQLRLGHGEVGAEGKLAFVDASPDAARRDRSRPAASTSARCWRGSSTR